MSSRSQNFLVIVSIIQSSHCKAAKYTGGEGAEKKRKKHIYLYN